MDKRFVFKEVRLLVSTRAITDQLTEQYCLLLEDLSRDHIKLSRTEASDWLWCSIARADITLWIIDQHSGRLVGTAQAMVQNLLRPKFTIDEVVVAKEYRQLGLGKALITELISRGRTKWPKCTRVRLTNHPERGNGAFYERLGFARKGTNVYEMKFA